MQVTIPVQKCGSGECADLFRSQSQEGGERSAPVPLSNPVE